MVQSAIELVSRSLAAIRSAFGPSPLLFESGITGLAFEVTDAFELNKHPVYPFLHAVHMDKMKEKAIQPLSFDDIEKSIGEEKIGNTLFFDAPPGDPDRRNYFRALTFDEKTVTLVFCGLYGLHDYKFIKPFILPKDAPFFSGIRIQNNIDKESGKNLSLSRMQELNRKNYPKNPLGIEYSEVLMLTHTAAPYVKNPHFNNYIMPQR